MTMRKPLTRPWTEGEIRTMAELAVQGLSTSSIARRIRRSRPSVKKKAEELGLKLLPFRKAKPG